MEHFQHQLHIQSRPSSISVAKNNDTQDKEVAFTAISQINGLHDPVGEVLFRKGSNWQNRETADYSAVYS